MLIYNMGAEVRRSYSFRKRWDSGRRGTRTTDGLLVIVTLIVVTGGLALTTIPSVQASIAPLADSLIDTFQSHPNSIGYLIGALIGAFIAGVYFERFRALRAKQKWLAKQGITDQTPTGNLFRLIQPRFSPEIDPTEQLRIVIDADFEKRHLLTKSEARVLYAFENAVRHANLGWRVMAQVSLGEVLSSSDERAYAAINSKRVDMLIVSTNGIPIAAIEYQGTGHYQGSAAARDAVKKEALRKAGVGYIEVTPEHDLEELARREIVRISSSPAFSG